ncbi:MAG: HEAT repeat domain-containing protein [Chloroflexi bacterium]|nr:HEAT repeat domain-containing protein [Chloroflexota bacterium]MBU1751982.1 HEAT repeat domain-containing protein [Chloroflexota bacterium]
MLYDIWNPYDPDPDDSPADRARLYGRMSRDQRAVRAMLPGLRREIENPQRDMNTVHDALRPYFDTGRDLPMTPADLPEIESLYRLVLDRGGLRQNEIQRVLLRLVGATADPASVSFLLEALHYTRRGDHFGPQRRQVALWGLARIARFHNVPEAYAALREGLADRRAEVRLTAANLILDAYLSARRDVPPDIVSQLRQMARSDPDADVRRVITRYLREPWAQELD